MPGAKVLEKTSDDAYKVAIKVKLGPVTMTYRGDVTVVERDPEKHSAVLDVKAKEARGQGGANAKVAMSVEPADQGTRGQMHTSVQLSGKAAAMSRGVLDDVSKRLVEQFAQNLDGIVAAPDGASGAEAAAPSANEASLDAGSLAADMATERARDPRVLVTAILGALLLVWLI